MHPTPGRSRPPCTPPAVNGSASAVVAPAVTGQGVCTHVLSLAIAQFRRDWPFMAARLESMRGRA
jgi:hypothetical protein